MPARVRERIFEHLPYPARAWGIAEHTRSLDDAACRAAHTYAGIRTGSSGCPAGPRSQTGCSHRSHERHGGEDTARLFPACTPDAAEQWLPRLVQRTQPRPAQAPAIRQPGCCCSTGSLIRSPAQ
ncbi:hypothetical protein ACIBBE_17055 [Streptomyces sp. NPDC051644]|uniref:hypothetical protein n=1 Tax=Streptomyces sp. NPDC051644 TaxID=3365666 RepID=UPI0037BAFB34